MDHVVMRVWLPDRPGALGAVASRIGAVQGEIVGIDILETGGGRAIDELTISLPSGGLVDLLVREVTQVDGVDVEDVRSVASSVPDPRLDALETAAFMAEQQSVTALLAGICDHVRRDFAAMWVVVADTEGSDGPAVLLARDGQAPPSEWLCAFLVGSRSSALVASGRSGPEDVAWSSLDRAQLALVVGRDGRPFRDRERRYLSALARIADARWSDLVLAAGRQLHPSAV